MPNRYKHLPLKQKIIIYIACAVAAAVAAIGVICLIVYLCNRGLPVASPFSSNTSDVTSEYYDTVEIIEPEAPTLPTEPQAGDEIAPQITVSDIKEMVDAVEQTEENTVVVMPSSIDTSGLKLRQVKLHVKYLAQNPELPTGCEITSLTTVLNYLGYDVTKVTMADDFLEKSIDKVANFWEVFLGDPKSNGFGCYAQPIVNAANKYLNTQDKKYIAVNRSGTRFEELLSVVENGTPVIIWGTVYGDEEKDLREPYTTYKWEVDGKTIQWISPEHCMVLIGYDLDRNVAIMSDPQRGIVEYSLDTVKSRYIALHSQCVILEENDLPPTINGVTDGETYYTTQYVTVADYNFASVTVNGEKCDTAFFIDGNADNTYEIVAKDTAGNTAKVTVHTKSIASIAEPIVDLTELNVTADHREAVDTVRNTALAISTAYAVPEEAKALNELIISCDTLLDKIAAVTNEYNRIVTAVGDYDDEILEEVDKDIITQLILDIEALTASSNLTEEQHTRLAELKLKCEELLTQIPKPEPDEPLKQ